MNAHRINEIVHVLFSICTSLILLKRNITTPIELMRVFTHLVFYLQKFNTVENKYGLLCVEKSLK